jgi:hypothetical protein
MPCFTFKSDPPLERKFKKYIDPNNFNVIIQSKMQDWKEIAADMFLELVGEDVENPKARH